MRFLMAGLFILVASYSCAAFAEKCATLQTWPVDPLVKVFPDATPSRGGKAVAEVARGETATVQIVVRSSKPVSGLKAEVSDLRRSGGREALSSRKPRFVGYVPVDRPTQSPSKDQLRKPPADYPDPLLEVETMDVPAGQAQPVWITVPVAEDVKPGRYKGILTLSGTVDAKPASAKRPFSVHVYEAVVGPSRLKVTDWFAMHAAHMQINPQPDSDEYYALMRRYARDMAEHRHNVALISPLGLADFRVGKDGKLEIDFSRFDRWVQIFKEEGVIGYIEGGHIGGRNGDWESQFVVQTRQIKDGQIVSASVDPGSPEADQFYAQFFPALVKHLREKGWLDIYMQHLADEPIAPNIETYRAMAALARKYAPELRIIEACHTKDLVGAMDVWVPQLNFLHHDFAHYQERQKAGEEVWFYTCVFPQGEYANRFIELPLVKTRLLHWINYQYGVTGYLHWGYNHWTADSPFTHTTRPHGGPPYLPAGDAWVVYPGKEGPLDSIRFEAMRDGIADYELLSLLAEKDKAAADRLSAKHVLDFDKYETDVKGFRKTRRTLLKKLGRS